VGTCGALEPLPEHHAVVIARDGEDRPVVGAERLIELIVVILRLAEIVDHVAQVKEKGRTIDALHVRHHSVGDRGLVTERGGGGLRPVDLGGAGIADRMERDFSRALDRRHDVGGKEVGEVQRLVVAAPWDRLHLCLVRQEIGRVVIGRAGIVLPELDLVRSGRRVGKQSAAGADQIRRHGLFSLKLFATIREWRLLSVRRWPILRCADLHAWVTQIRTTVRCRSMESMRPDQGDWNALSVTASARGFQASE
jgi:hypothetical protein